MHDFNAQRLHVETPLGAGQDIAASPQQANYLLNVLRLAAGDAILVFNGRDGEWLARVTPKGKRGCELAIVRQVRAQQGGPDIDYLFAPLKRVRLDYMVQKATEMGVARLRPVITRRTVAERVNVERMRANAVEAAEQCGILRVPQIAAPEKLERVIAGWDAGRRLVMCDEAAPLASPLAALQNGFSTPLAGEVARSAGEGRNAAQPLAVLIGPEGGFDPAERELLLAQPFTLAISLGPRIMRADTAAVAALALVNAVLGDWR
jgi:16S rRNA (uracil1498-N3)-methyltransferase